VTEQQQYERKYLPLINLYMAGFRYTTRKLIAVICLEDGRWSKDAEYLDEIDSHSSVCPLAQGMQLAELDSMTLVV
jgi:hypothetical protein